MPYRSDEELPAGIRHTLPAHARHIYLAAYNNAAAEYADPAKRRGNTAAEEVARKVAWAAVKKEYRKNEATGVWEKIE